MKTIGLIGGMSWESTVEYYRIMNEEVKNHLGGLHSAKCLLYSVNFEEIERYQSEGDWDSAGKQLAEVASSLERAGADFLVLCTNTMHKVITYIEEKVNIPVLHIGDATAAKINGSNIQKIGLLGTKYTMEQDFYKARLEANGLQVMVPNETEREQINSIIFEELCLGKINSTSKEYYQQVIKKLVDDGAEGIILGCTEIGLLIKPADADVPLFDTALIHAQAAVSQALINDKG
ncbi:aspartate/glutamate racemase family protein [Gracilibacillus sp. S3-1-1]|uniref:Aspartate/glutamate racemase family protein n=1 Tax=Gracilibacillus pellucidus TaxID=3095368 RepID=A0ACC6M0N4_9BACI|nr:aspartate/glutamate racemase family protein [Gracilibacillus sp. S3-1-1]MDX8044438.1 aspartate/glutamate racemase family protein [Gracilibacillus sp. S3-1-1]